MKTPEENYPERKRLDAEIEKQLLVVAAIDYDTTHRPSIPKTARQQLATLKLERAFLDCSNLFELLLLY